MRPGMVSLGLLCVALAFGLHTAAEAAKLHLRDGILAIECHWTTDDGVIATRGGVTIRIAREDVVRIEDESPAPEPCQSIAPEPTMTLGGLSSGAPANPPEPAASPSGQLSSRSRASLLGSSGLVPAAEMALTAPQQRSLEDIRQFAIDTARLYQLPGPVEVSVLALGSSRLRTFAGVGASYSLGRIHVDPNMLGLPNHDALIAKVLAYELIPPVREVTSLADHERQRQQRDMDANAKAVELLERVKGWPERAALHSVYYWLLGLHHARGRAPRYGQAAPCDQIRDLLARFPEQRGWTAGLTCAPP